MDPALPPTASRSVRPGAGAAADHIGPVQGVDKVIDRAGTDEMPRWLKVVIERQRGPAAEPLWATTGSYTRAVPIAP